MKSTKLYSIIAGVAAMAATACTSYEIEMPENPQPPALGREVSHNVLYQANPRFFGQNDCFGGIKAQLPRIASMGCDILWLMPVCDPGELNAIGSPYCIRNFEALNPRYGNADDLKSLIADAHSRGMRVILDWIANHTAWDCPWITAHPDWYEHDAAGNIVAANGWSDVAQLDFSNPGLCSAMKDAMLYWMTGYGIDGFRCDYAEGVPHEFWRDAIAAIRSIDPSAIMLAETSKTSFYDDGFDMIYDWNSAPAISDAFKGGKPSGVITEATEALAKVPEGKSILRYVFNHDVAAENNVATMYGSPQGVPAAYVIASMLNGTPMIYSSMDVEGLSGKLSFFNYTTLDFSEALSQQYAAINKAFVESVEVRRGELRNFSNSSVVCFERAIPGQSLLVAVNVTAAEQTVRTPITLAGSAMKNLIEGTEVNVPIELTLPPYGYIILMN